MDIFLLFIFRVCRAFLSVLCSLVLTCWQRAGLRLGSRVCDVVLCLCHFSMWCVTAYLSAFLLKK